MRDGVSRWHLLDDRDAVNRVVIRVVNRVATPTPGTRVTQVVTRVANRVVGRVVTPTPGARDGVSRSHLLDDRGADADRRAVTCLMTVLYVPDSGLDCLICARFWP